MSHENHNASGEDEYQFPKDEYVVNEQHSDHVDASAEHAQAASVEDDEEVASPRRGPGFIHALKERLPFLQNKRLMIVIVAVIIALIVFKFFEGSDTTTVPVNKPAPVQPAQPVVEQTSPAVTDELSALTQRANDDQTSMGQLKTQVEQLKTSLHASTSAQIQMNQSLNSLVDEVKTLDSQLAHMKQKPKKAVKKTPPPPPIVYHLKAVVPGRAWIVDNHDNSVTVTVGSAVQQYGVVKAINADQGLVLTSSGKVIGYGANDF